MTILLWKSNNIKLLSVQNISDHFLSVFEATFATFDVHDMNLDAQSFI